MEEQEIIDQKYKLEDYEKCIQMIKDLLPTEKETLTIDEFKGLVEEIDYMIRSL